MLGAFAGDSEPTVLLEAPLSLSGRSVAYLGGPSTWFGLADERQEDDENKLQGHFGWIASVQ